MCTATATTHRHVIEQVHLEVVPALAEDFKELDAYDNEGKPIYKLKLGQVFFIKSIQTGKLDPIPYITTTNTLPSQIKQWLDAKVIFITQCPFKD